MNNCADGSFGTIVPNRTFGTIVTDVSFSTICIFINGSFHFTIMGAIVSDHELEDLVIHWRQWRQPPLDYFAVQLQWCHMSHWCQCIIWLLNGAIGSPNDPLSLDGGLEMSITTEWLKWHHLIWSNGDQHWIQWMPMPPTTPMVIVIVIGATDRRSDRHWIIWRSFWSTQTIHCRQGRQMIYSPIYLTLMPISEPALALKFLNEVQQVIEVLLTKDVTASNQ